MQIKPERLIVLGWLELAKQGPIKHLRIWQISEKHTGKSALTTIHSIKVDPKVI